MPFTKLGGGQYQGPSGKKFNLNQVRMYYARGGNFPGQKSMGADFPKASGHNSPTMPGEAGRPVLDPSGQINCATSPTPTSILKGGRQYFGPLEYGSQRIRDQEYQGRDITSQGNISNPARPWPYNKRSK